MIKKLSLSLLLLCSLMTLVAQAPKALIITGQHNTHNWEVSHVILHELLEEGGFDVDIALSPKKGEDMSGFNPDFEPYNLVVMDYNGDMWCEEMKRGFLDYVQKGEGGVYLYHAANTIFGDWEEYQKITALGAFGGRGAHTPGVYAKWEDNQLVKYEAHGTVGHHGVRHDFTINCRNPKHPAVDPKLPKKAVMTYDELYDQTKGPGNIKDVLYTAYSETSTGGTGREEVLVFTVDYGKARIFHSMLGHAGDSREDSPAMTCKTFRKTLLAGARWAAGVK